MHFYTNIATKAKRTNVSVRFFALYGVAERYRAIPQKCYREQFVLHASMRHLTRASGRDNVVCVAKQQFLIVSLTLRNH